VIIGRNNEVKVKGMTSKSCAVGNDETYSCSGTLIAPEDAEPSLLWPEPGRGPVGSEVIVTFTVDMLQIGRDEMDSETDYLISVKSQWNWTYPKI